MQNEVNILIVDDEPEMCWVLENILKREGYKVTSITSGKEALRLCEGNNFELAFLDAKLPDIDGVELAKLLKQKSPDTRIIMISGFYYRNAEAIQKGLTEGYFSGFIAKPFKLDEIRGAVRNVFFVA